MVNIFKLSIMYVKHSGTVLHLKDYFKYQLNYLAVGILRFNFNLQYSVLLFYILCFHSRKEHLPPYCIYQDALLSEHFIWYFSTSALLKT